MQSRARQKQKGPPNPGVRRSKGASKTRPSPAQIRSESSPHHVQLSCDLEPGAHLQAPMVKKKIRKRKNSIGRLSTIIRLTTPNFVYVGIHRRLHILVHNFFSFSFSDNGVGFGRWQQPVCPASLRNSIHSLSQQTTNQQTNKQQTNKSKGWREFSQVHPTGTARPS
ncbi:hypothetical protein BGZ61DRAFT_80351 [Ilyonectria robusta]|uniref:uncharacterized protein n=1 Tax=Ilyonectria robusta TaxID=1079257 RepID=UPI001E8D85FA|nr:uncharacterized protein BGZ61DRAFT_80351 [Ilyonectria robusta]KAH8735492.1 hypothetical protein BGZ61DRAFT_80351 [Ilyonectria robusta]